MTLPYLFAPQACAPLRSLGLIASPASEFFDVFDPIPARSTFVFPEILSGEGVRRPASPFKFQRTEFDSSTALRFAPSVTALFSSLERVIWERRLRPASLLPFAGSPWRVVDHDMKEADYLRSIMLDGPLGKVIDIRRDGPAGPYRFEFGWMSSGISVLQNLILSHGKSGFQWELGFFLEFQGCGLSSLREFLGMTDDSLCRLLHWFREALLRSGLFESRTLTSTRLSTVLERNAVTHSLVFENQPRVLLQSAARADPLRPRDPTSVAEEISLEVVLPPATSAVPLGPLLEPVWNFGEVLVHHQSAPIFGMQGVNEPN